MTVVDLSQRQQALDPERSFAVSAPAGSGKTGLLTQRVLKLLSRVEQPEEILCLTFTRKAAAEMRSRIISALATATSAREPDDAFEAATWQLAKQALERDQQQGWQLLKSPNRLRITTIDGFFRYLAQQLALESQLGDQIEPLDNPGPCYDQVVAAFLLSQLRENGTWADDISTLLQHLDNDLNRVQSLLTGLLEKREQWLHHLLAARNARSYLEQALRDTIAEKLNELTELLLPIGSDLAILMDYAAGNLLANNREAPLTSCAGITGLPPCDHTQTEQWLGLVQLLLTDKGEYRSDRGISITLGFPTAKADPEFGDLRKQQLRETLAWCRQQEGLRDLLIDTRYLPTACYSDQQWAVLNALTSLMPALAANLSLYFKQQGCSDFTEITFAALRALSTDEVPTDLAMKLDYRLRHILIDEFQDTSSIQYLILRHLIAEWTPGDGRTLFIVGDGMQSLYGFRSANVGLFLEARQQPVANIQLQPLDLRVNFRSQKGIIDWVNEAFGEAFPALENIDRGAVSYCPAESFKPVADGPAVTIDIFRDHPDNSAEAMEVVRLVEEARQQRPDGSIAILVRSRNHLRTVLKYLRDAGISWQATEFDPLQHKMAVIDLMSLTRALLSAADHIAWLSILRATWCGLDLHDLYHLVNQQRSGSGERNSDRSNRPKRALLIDQLACHQQIENISPDGQKILHRISGILLRAWHQRERQPLRQLVENTWLALGGPEAVKNPTDRESCQQYFDFLEQQSPVDDWSLFQTAVEKLYAAPDSAADRHVQVMTIHKSKGLEFDTVIIPGLDRGNRPGQQDLLLWRERIAEDGQAQLLIAPLQAAGQDKDPLYRHLQWEAGIKETLESTRVIYVGATRAIRQLHLLCNMKSGKPPANNSLLARLWPWLEKAIEEQHPSIRLRQAAAVEKEKQDDTAIPVASFSHLWRLPPGFKGTGHIEPLQGRTLAQADNSLLFEPGAGDARHIGTLLHRIIRQVTLQGISYWRQTPPAERQPHWLGQLRQLGVVNTSDALSRLQVAVANILEDSENHWLLDNDSVDSLCEYAIGYLDEDNRVRSAVIDRTFIRDGIRWIIDYKSSCPLEGQPMDEFVREQMQQYAAQMALYERLMLSMDGNRAKTPPIRKALYFPFCKHLAIVS